MGGTLNESQNVKIPCYVGPLNEIYYKRIAATLKMCIKYKNLINAGLQQAYYWSVW